jgi:predicted branched-subunit amino acid permease
MKHHLSCLKGDTIKAIILVCLAVGVVGMSYGSLAMAYGFPVWVPFVLSITVLAGASEFMFIGIVAAAVIRWRLPLRACWSTRAMCRLA